MADRSFFSEVNEFSSSDDTISECSDLFENDIYPLKGDDFDKLKDQLSKTRNWNKEL
ncbi:pre-mrna-splicing factor [Vairimorpha ceranae]|uniref:Pre-mrna-splicing factor n=1 Tax=Vairimorpha ceranae TaxID=40302 RepID=A0A0F9ZAX6_9MICR|nr:pre-mrna-splicing factor [Vairimorpha ceranae]KKO74854.1 pre-mrna-splicing factor [Vairimorpha ceranae]